MWWARLLRYGANRYVAFLSVVVVSAFTPFVLPSGEVNMAWWWAAAGTIVASTTLAGYGTRIPRPNPAFILGPVLLYPAIHFLRCSDGNGASGFTPLILLPTVWFALYGRLRDVLVSIVAGALTAFLPLIVVGTPQYPAAGWRSAILLVVLAGSIGPLIDRLVARTGRAIQALRRTESEFRATFEQAPIGMAVLPLDTAPDYTCSRVNTALCVMLGYTAEELTSRPVREFIHPDDQALSRERFQAAVSAGRSDRFEKRYLHRSGRTIWVAITYTVVQVRGEPHHLIIQIDDITARLESEAALLDAYETDRAAARRLADLERIRSEMASTVSHELRTPLTSAAGYVELLTEGVGGPLSDEQTSMLGVVARSLTRLERIVADVLSIAAPSDAVVAPTAIADLDSVVRAAVESLSLQAALRDQTIETTGDSGGSKVTGEDSRLERVFVNLISNALKFSAEGATVHVHTQRTEREVTVSVTDPGIGIAPADQAHIFERFFRVADAAQYEITGSGLGLAIVRSIVTQYGGTVAVESTPGEGSTFTVHLPTRDRQGLVV